MANVKHPHPRRANARRTRQLRHASYKNKRPGLRRSSERRFACVWRASRSRQLIAMRAFAFLSFTALAAAQFQLSLPAPLNSIAGALQSLADPSATARPASKPTPAPAPSPSPKPPSPKPKPVGATTESSSSSVSVLISSTQSTKSSPSSTSSKSTTLQTTTTSRTTPTHGVESATTPTETAKPSTSGGLSQQSKIGIGVGIGVLVFVGLLAAALYSFVQDRHSSEAYAAWRSVERYVINKTLTDTACRERRNQKRERLGSSASHSSFPFVGEKEMELKRVERGDLVNFPKSGTYSLVAASKASQSVDKDLPVPPATYQPPKQIKRKAVPGQTLQKPRFSWMN